ncbi:MAG: 6,7-dimethyl-8-ribityllumazine synthase [Patescibacteria group bacterium]
MQLEHQKKNLDGSNYKIGIVESSYNEDIKSGLLKGCLAALEECKVKKENVDVLEVPGSFELPVGVQKLAERKKYDAIICLGVVIKGETNHDEYIAGAAAHGITDVALKYNLPVLFGVITALNLEQAIARSADDEQNRGYAAAIGAVQILENFKKLA